MPKRNNQINKNIIDLILVSADFIKQICENTALNEDETFLDAIYAHLKNLEGEENNNIDAIIDGNLKTPEGFTNEFFNEFVAEAADHLDSIESNTLKLEKNINESEIIHILFRDFHSIKGLAGFAGQTLIQRIAHQAENLLDGCRKGHLVVNKNIIDLLLNSVDNIKRICENSSLINQQDFLEDIYNHIQALEDEEEIAEKQVN